MRGGAFPGGAFPGGARQSRTDPGRLIRAIIEGLAINGAPPAAQTLSQVLSGEVETAVNDDKLTDWVLTAALDNYGGSDHATHALLEKAVHNPTEFGASRSAKLRRRTMEILAATAVSVIDHLMGVSVAAASSRPAGGSPMAGRPPMEAGGPMPRGGPAEAGAAIPGAAGRGGPMAPGQAAGGAVTGPLIEPRPMSAEAVQRAVQYLWRAETVAIIEEAAGGVESFEEGLETLALAGSFPMAGVRTRTFNLLNEHWQESAVPLIAAGLYESAVRDPGLIVVLKQLKRAMPPTGALASVMSGLGDQQASRSARDTKTKYTWTAASAQLVLAVNERLRAATPDSDEGNPPKLPFRLHREARVVGVREVNWPADVSELSSGLTPPGQFTLQYVRMSLAGEELPKVFQFYKKQLKRNNEYKSTSPQFAWIDSISAGSELSLRRSVDVVFTPASQRNGINQAAAGPGGPAGPGALAGPGGAAGPAAGPGGRGFNAGQPGGSADFTIEILVVEIPDPKPAKTD